MFVIVLVGTTLQLLTERYRQARAENQWRKRVNGHTIIVGYGTMGRTAADSLRAHTELAARDIVVIDVLPEALSLASEHGLVGVLGDATRPRRCTEPASGGRRRGRDVQPRRPRRWSR